MRPFVLILAGFPVAAVAETFERPIPQPQTAEVEVWFLVASIALILALAAVHMLVRRR